MPKIPRAGLITEVDQTLPEVEMMAEGKMRVLDKDFEEKIGEKAGEVRAAARKDIAMAEKYVEMGKQDFESKVKDHPTAFVLGAFVGGLILGALLSKRG